MSVLEMNNIKKSFGSKVVLEDITLKVEKGEVVSIIGPSGSGKSTLLRCATFLERIDNGEISYIDKKIVNKGAVYPPKKELQQACANFGLVFQNFNLFPHFSVMKNISDAPIVIQKRDKEEVYRETRELLKKVGIEDKENAYPCELSGGQQQRVAIARAIAQAPPIILADEPTGNLDSGSSKEIMGILKSLHEEGRTVILITHDNEIARQAKRIIKIIDGQIVQDSKDGQEPEQIQESETSTGS